MLRLILIFIVGMFVAVGVLAIALYHFFGVNGLIAFPFVVAALVWVAKWLIKNLVRKFALSLFGMKARALRGAAMNVHSIKAVPKPAEAEEEVDEDGDEEEDEKDSPPSLSSGAAGEEKKEDEKSALSHETGEPRDYVELDVTITPKADSANRFWEPGELILTSEKINSVTDLGEKSVGATHTVEVWDGTAFGADDECKYPGEQRLKIIFEVKPGTKSGWLCYYNEPIGRLELPVGTVEV
ncbi:MAG TPA: hypothetical protein VMF08_20800 [Candidatus Sulfotelmatobacter sp.]|nr:hypothetical protein [Candidatus Sulfotelmatobacter sp.]